MNKEKANLIVFKKARFLWETGYFLKKQSQYFWQIIELRKVENIKFYHHIVYPFK